VEAYHTDNGIYCWKKLIQGAGVLTLGRSPGYPGVHV
jgi:hypothetical protein